MKFFYQRTFVSIIVSFVVPFKMEWLQKFSISWLKSNFQVFSIQFRKFESHTVIIPPFQLLIISCNLLSFFIFFLPFSIEMKEIARFDRTPNASIIANVQRHTARGNLVAQSSSKVPSQFWYRLQQSILQVVDVWQGNKNHCFRCYYLFPLSPSSNSLNFFRLVEISFYLFIFSNWNNNLQRRRKHFSSLQLRWREAWYTSFYFPSSLAFSSSPFHRYFIRYQFVYKISNSFFFFSFLLL